MRRKVSIFFAAFIVVSILGLSALVTVNYMKRKGFEVVLTEDNKVGVKISDIHYSQTRDGHVEWVLDADSAASLKSEDLVVFDSVRLAFYGDDVALYTLKAREGRFLESTGEIDVTGDVLLESVDGSYRLKTDSLKYSSDPRRITTDDRVEIVTGSMVVEGAGLVVEVDKERLFILNDVKALLKDEAI